MKLLVADYFSLVLTWDTVFFLYSPKPFSCQSQFRFHVTESEIRNFRSRHSVAVAGFHEADPEDCQLSEGIEKGKYFGKRLHRL
jgi:hypothetical protein